MVHFQVWSGEPIVYRFCVAVVLLAVASGIAVGGGKPEREKASFYVGTLADGSTLTLEATRGKVKFQFSNQWSVDTESSTAKETESQ
jgi:hypothetical protein